MPKVLVVDDSIAVRKVAERLLIDAGMGVTLVVNGEEALAYLAKETPDLVVSDVIMPDKSGYEVCAFMRARKELVNTPVLLISGIVNDEVMKQAESCHADKVLKKPFLGTSLRDCVLELLAKRQGAVAPVAKSIEKATESIEPIQNARLSDEQFEVYRQAAARLKPLEEELRLERDRATHSAQRVAQLEGQLGSVKELESMLAREREQVAQLKKKLAEADSATSRVQELEAALYTESQAATQLVQQMTATMETSVTRSQEGAARVSALEQALAAEQERSRGLAARLAEAERSSQRAPEFETLLQTERERNSLLARHVSETEQTADLATKRFDEMVKKLAEIAGLASQLGSGKRQP
jgi:DNA-binding response OmpR family regulator